MVANATAAQDAAGVGRSKCPPHTGAKASVGKWTTVAGISEEGAGLDGADMWQSHAEVLQQLFACGKQQASTGAGTLALSANASNAVKAVATAFMRGQR